MPAFLEAGSLFSASLFEENVVNLLDYIGPRSCFQPRFMASGVNLILSNMGIGTCFQPRFMASGVNLVVSLHYQHKSLSLQTILQSLLLQTLTPSICHLCDQQITTGNHLYFSTYHIAKNTTLITERNKQGNYLCVVIPI